MYRKYANTFQNIAPDVPLAHGYINGCILLAMAAFNRQDMEKKHQELIDRLPKMYQDIGCRGRFAEGECDKRNADLFVNASREHPFRKNNARDSTDDECHELLRQSRSILSTV